MSDPGEAETKNWIEVQDELKKRLITEDDFSWKLPSQIEKEEEEEDGALLKYVGGVDISFSKEDPSIACGCLIVLQLKTLQIVYQDLCLLRLQVPYVPGFLAFREAPVLLQLLDNMKKNANPFYPQIHVNSYCWLMAMDCSILEASLFAYYCAMYFFTFIHHWLSMTVIYQLSCQGFGLACHLGVLANLPTIGIGKNLHHVDGLTHSTVRQLLQAKENSNGNIITLTGASGFTWGVAMKSTEDTLKPIFISIGHRISLDSAIMIVKMTCKYRVPEPIRQADIRSRDYLQKHQMGQ